MANPADILKEYLVSLGFQIDSEAYRRFTDTVNKTTEQVTKSASEMAKGFAGSATVVTTAFAAIGFGTVELFSKIAKADMEYQKLAMHMFMSKDAAKDMKIATDALGESIQDIAWNPELRSHYNELVKQQREMRTPGDASGQLRMIRDVEFEFTRLRVTATRAFEWVGYYLFKHLAGPIKQIKESLTSITDWLQLNMPQWTEKLASMLSTIIEVGGSVVRFLMDILSGLKQIWDIMPGWGKAIAAALLVATSPLAAWTAAITAVILLIDDFYAYIDGRKSSKTLAPIWNVLVKTMDYVIKSIVTTLALLDYLYDKLSGDSRKLKLSDVISDAWNNSGFSQTIKGPSSTAPDKTPVTTGSLGNVLARASSGIADAKTGMFNNLKFGMGNYQAMAGQSYQNNSATTKNESNVNIDVGGVTVNVPNTNATPMDISQAVTDGINNSFNKKTFMNIRQLSGAMK